ncbi:MAG: hypothetical protein AB1512_02630 [Thermodesulfobacteriota bacterium]
MDEIVTTKADTAVPCLVGMVDLRGFTAFSSAQDDLGSLGKFAEVTLRYVFQKLDESGSAEKCWAKPLGDGLLLVANMKDFQEKKMINISKELVSHLVKISEQFPAYVDRERPGGLTRVPNALGIGITFGPLVPIRIHSAQLNIDLQEYVGPAINLASRLQDVARPGGCVVHSDVYEKLMSRDPDASKLFEALFKKPTEIAVQGIGEVSVYYTGGIDPIYLKSQREEELLQRLARQSISELQTTYVRKRTAQNPYVQLPETVRFIFFRKEGEVYEEKINCLMNERMPMKRHAKIAGEDLNKGKNPIIDAIITGKHQVIGYKIRYDQCDVTDENCAYWRETKERFPKANIEAYRGFPFHPSSIMVIPISDRSGSEVKSVVAFDSLDINLFNEQMADEMDAKLPLIYNQFFGMEDKEGLTEVRL